MSEGTGIAAAGAPSRFALTKEALRSAVEPGRRIAVVGGFRSGTNYLRFLLEANFACVVRFDRFGWKHAGIPIQQRWRRTRDLRAPVVGVSRDPFAFLRSVHRYHVEVGRNIDASADWAAFLRNSFTVFDGNKTRSPQYRFANPVQYWNFVNWNLATLPELTIRSAHVRYEELAADPERVVMKLASEMGLKRRRAEFEAPIGKLKRTAGGRHDVSSQVSKTQGFDRTEILQSDPRESYAVEDADYVWSELDKELLRLTGHRSKDFE